MAKKKYYNGNEGMRHEDGGMLHEDRSAIANLPQDVKYHAWPEANDYRDYNLNDNIMGIDVQMKDDSKRGKRDKYPQKY